MLASGEALHPIWAGREELPGTAAGAHECADSRRHVYVGIRIYSCPPGALEFVFEVLPIF